MTTLMLASLLGVLVGVVMALTGAGGGVMAVPLLVTVLQLSMTQAVPLGLLVVAAAASVGALAGWREGLLRYRAAALLGGLAMVSAPMGLALAHRLPAAYLLLGSALVLGWTSWRMLALAAQAAGAATAPPRQPPACVVNAESGRLRWTAPCAWRLAGTGVLSGLFTGLLGVGGGFVIVPALSRFTTLDARSITATPLAVIALAASAALLGSGAVARLDLPLSLAFAGPACVALLLARRWSRRWSAASLRRGFALLCAVMACVMLVQGWVQALRA